jgi:DNA-binding MarR family transcriptional regulator
MVVADQTELDMGFLTDLLGYRIRLVQIAAYKDFEAVTKGFGQSPRYFGLLSLIEANPGLPQGKLAEAVHLVRSSLVPIIDKLEAEGIVERRPSRCDRRLKAVWLTSKGKKLVGRLRPFVTKHEDRLTAGMSADEKASLLGLLQRVDINLRRQADAAEVA